MPITTPEQLALAREVSEHIRTYPGQHDQGDWFRETECGTTACIAGWTAVLGGAELVKNEPDVGQLVADRVRNADGGVRSIASYAQEALGLTRDEANELFYSRERRAVSYLDGLITKGEDWIAGVRR